MKKSGASFSRGNSKQTYETPPEFMRAVSKRFGPVWFDLACVPETAKAKRFYTPDDDSFGHDWHKNQGLQWLNPPYDNIAPWAERCAKESKLGAKILFLVPASVGSNWHANFVHNIAHVLLLNGRIQFVGAKDPYPKDCYLACYGFNRCGYDVWRWAKCS